MQYDFFVKNIITASVSNEGLDEHVHMGNLDWGFAAFKLTVYDRKTFLVLLHVPFMFVLSLVHLQHGKIQVSSESL